MFRTAELGQKVSKSEFNQREPLLRQALLEAQANLRVDSDFPVIILFAPKPQNPMVWCQIFYI